MAHFVDGVKRSCLRTDTNRSDTLTRWRPSVEPLEDRLTPAMMAYLTGDTSWGQWELPSSGTASVTVELIGLLHVGAGSAEQTARFTLDDTIALSSLGGPDTRGATHSVQLESAEERVTLQIGGAEDTVSVKTTGRAILQMTDAGEAVTVKTHDRIVFNMNIAGVGSEADVALTETVHDQFAGSTPPPANWVPGSATSVHTDGVQLDSWGNVSLKKARSTALAGSVGGVQVNDGIDLFSDGDRVLHERKKVSFGPESSGAGGATGAALTDAEAVAFNCTTGTFDFTDHWAMAGAVAGFHYDAGDDVKWGDASIKLRDVRTATGAISPIASLEDVAVAPGLDLAAALGGSGGRGDVAPELTLLVTAPYDLSDQGTHSSDTQRVNGEVILLVVNVSPLSSEPSP
jgi:hypothetical protein